MRLQLLLISSAIFAAATPASAAPRDEQKVDELPSVFEAVLGCRLITAEAERLACFDRSVAAMANAREQKDLVVADRATLRETKKGLFGFTLPKLRLFGDTEGEDVAQIESTIAGVRTGKDGFAVFTLPDGARWKQTDGGQSWARTGDKIVIKRAALGSYMARIGNRAAIRVLRLAN
ncbi:hypothetical protein [Novosphingobium huizhouense]|uniref:hypothetical protein n=1 Tax=Novosphingobium huizhouense TaxID=2866625 RepID=UPI001CD88F6F|nr:hypothetical protein [Novosphingobium huizhouense]